MKVLIINSNDIEGGAARAANRLHQGLKQARVDSLMLVADKLSDDPSVIGPATFFNKAVNKLRPILDPMLLHLYRHRTKVPWSLSCLPHNIAKKVTAINPDLVHLHWIGGGFFPVENLKRFKKPIVWTLHDMWPFTGGCHYSEGCSRYNQRCGQCPLLGSHSGFDLSRWLTNRKRRSWQNLNLAIVTPSRWLAECAKSSSLFSDCRIEVIPNGIDTETFKPIKQEVAREILNLPQDKKIILFGAVSPTSDERKGFAYLQSALKYFAKGKIAKKCELLIFGTSQPEIALNLGLNIRYFGRVNDDFSLALLYSAADVFVIPSKQENLPNTIMESLACGTPVVGFDIGGIPDMIDHQKNGYLAKPFETKDLAAGIDWLLSTGNISKLRKSARQKVLDNFEIRQIARKHQALYKSIISSR